MSMLRRAALTAGALAFGAAGWEVQRRRDLSTISADPEWSELNRPLDGQVHPLLAHDGTLLHAEIHGPDGAPTIVLVHGWLEACRLWHHQIRDLSRDFRVVAYDQRGHGRSAPSANGEYSERLLARDLGAVIDALVPSGQRCVLAGHSMGAMAIIAWAGRNPAVANERVTGIALINTWIHQLVERLGILGDWFGSRATTGAVIPGILQSPYNPPSRLDPISLRLVRRFAFAPSASLAQVAFAHQMFLTTPAPVRAGFAKMFTTLDLSAVVPHVTPRAVVIAGDQDRLTPPWHAEQLAATLPNLLRHTVLPDTGHMSPLEAPDAITAHLRALVSES
jgi:pimeloyl-ACP methyl ester carboxylesterase